VNPKEILTKERLQACFKSFDEDGSGSVSLEEIKAVIGK
jgi:Ca2+-binding EF-hand superfamily protein